MPLSQQQISNIDNVIRESLRDKFYNYKPEPAYMPFHFRLLGKDRMALYSFMHGLTTNFGTTIFEPVAKTLALANFADATLHQKAGDIISSEAHDVIQNIIDGLNNATTSPNKPEEIESIRLVCQQGEMRKVKPTKVDLKLVASTGTIYMFDLKTVKPNAGDFKEFKRTLLEWVATTLAVDPNANVQTLIAIPYNPYEPQPYNRWTMRGMLDLNNELRVADEFWNFVGGDGAYQILLDSFERIGIELRTEIDDYFNKFNRKD